jgi:hypothetical protein
MSQILLDSRVSDSDLDYKHDVQLLELQKKLHNITSERKKAQAHISTLENRLKLLKGEEDKVLKKVAQTRRVTLNKTTILEKIEADINFKIKVQEGREKEISELKKRNVKQKEIVNARTASNKQKKLRELKEEIGKRNEIKNTHTSFIKEMKILSKFTNKSKSNLIRVFRQAYKDKKDAVQNEKKSKLRNSINYNYNKEYRLKEEADKSIQKLAEEESKMISKIKTTTNIHKMSKFCVLNE